MKKSLSSVLVLVLTLSVGTFAFENEQDGFSRLSFGGLIGRYTNNFGELKDYLVLSSTFWGADLDFEGEEMRGLIVEYAITGNFKLQGEWNTCNTQINVKDGHGWTAYKAEYNLNEDVFLKSRMKEIFKFGSVRDIKMHPRVEYCDTLHTERGEK